MNEKELASNWAIFDPENKETFPDINKRILCETKFKEKPSDNIGIIYDIVAQKYHDEDYSFWKYNIFGDEELDIEHIYRWCYIENLF